MKILIWAVSIIFGLIVTSLALVLFAPGYDLNFVRSESMRPAVNMGDLMIAGPIKSGSINPGDILTYELGERLVTHRVLSVTGDILTTKGDANEDPDPRPVQFSQVESRYLFRIPYVGYLASFVRTRPGWFLAIILPAAALVGLIIKDIHKEVVKNGRQLRSVAGKTKQEIA